MTLTEEQRGTVAFDLGKAREAVHTLENFAFASGKITAGQIQDVLWGARLLATSAAEIERLRAAPIEYQNALDDVQNLKEQIETFHLRRENELRQMNEISWQNKTQTARIKELEDALVDELVKQQFWCGVIPSMDERKMVARQRLQADGKIGPDATRRSWQITEKRKDALGVILARIEYDQSQPGRFNYTISRAKDTLRTMLKEAE